MTELERRYAEFDGLNLTFETIEGLTKHNGPLVRRCEGAPLGRWRARGVPAAILRYDAMQRLDLSSMPASRRKRRQSLTILPMTRTTSTTVCAPACSRSPSFAPPFRSLMA